MVGLGVPEKQALGTKQGKQSAGSSGSGPDESKEEQAALLRVRSLLAPFVLRRLKVRTLLPRCPF